MGAFRAAREVVGVQEAIVEAEAIDVRAEITEFGVGPAVEAGFARATADWTQPVTLAAAVQSDFENASGVFRRNHWSSGRIGVLYPVDGVVEPGWRGGDVQAAVRDFGGPE